MSTITANGRATQDRPTSSPHTAHAAIWRLLAAPFHDNEVKELSKGGKRMPYITARSVMNRLDYTVGVENWWDRYVPGEHSVMCELTIRLPDGSTITKVDAGAYAGMSDPGDDDKSGFSDALKRAAAKFGVGRYLYGDGTPDYRPQPPAATPTRQDPSPALAQPRKLAAPSSPMSEPIPLRSWMDYVQERIDAINVDIAFACDDAKIPQVVLTNREGKPVNIYQVGNHLVKEWLKTGAVTKDQVADKLKKRAVVDAAWEQFPEDFRNDVEPYLKTEHRATLQSVGVEVAEDEPQWEEGRE